MDTSAILGFKAPDSMQSLSSLMGVANSAQQLQQNQQKTQQGGIDLQERQNAIQFLKGGSFVNPDGTLDNAKLTTGLTQVAPTTGMKIAQQYGEAHRGLTDASRAVNSLTSEVRTQIGSTLAAIPDGTPSDVVHGALDKLGSLYKGSEPAIVFAKQGYDNALKAGGQKAADAFRGQIARGVLPQDTQQAMNTPAGVELNSGQQSQLVNLKPGVQGVSQGAPVDGTLVNKVLPPGSQEAVTTDSQGNMVTVKRDAFGRVIGSGPVPGGGNSAQPTPGGPFAIPPGETPDTLKQAQSIRAASNQAAVTVPQVQFNSNQIIKLADETNTGKGAQILAGLGGQYAGIPWTSNSASNFNQLGHYMALQTAQLAQSTGIGGTDQGRAIAAEQAGTREWTAAGIKNTARVNRALSTGADLFNRGVESAVQTSNNPFAARDFQNKWAKVANVDALRLYDAFKNKGDDPSGFTQTVQDLGGVKSPKYKSTLDAVTQMRALIKGQ